MKTYENDDYDRLTEEQLIIKIRKVLDNPIGRGLYEDSFKTKDIDELKGILRSAKILFGTYIKDFEYYLNFNESVAP